VGAGEGGSRRIRKLAEVLGVNVSDLMRYAGYLPNGEAPEVQAEEPLHRLLGMVDALTNDQLIVLIATHGRPTGGGSASISSGRVDTPARGPKAEPSAYAWPV